MSTCLISYNLESVSYETPGTSPWVHNVDFDIPDGSQVTGSGALITAIYDSGSDIWVPIDSADIGLVATVSDEYLNAFSGPHPTDSTKWRIALSSVHAGALTVTAWMATIS